jgi:predicted nucleic acid-binding protein
MNVLSQQELSLCSIVLSELIIGALNHKTKSVELIDFYKGLGETMNIFDFDVQSAWVFANLKRNLIKQGKIIEDFDLMIASICLVNNLTLVTANTKHFERIEGLKIEDWTK